MCSLGSIFSRRLSLSFTGLAVVVRLSSPLQLENELLDFNLISPGTICKRLKGQGEREMEGDSLIRDGSGSLRLSW